MFIVNIEFQKFFCPFLKDNSSRPSTFLKLKQFAKFFVFSGGFFETPVWPDEPGCIKTCERFPNVPKMKKLSKDPILANRSIEYECKNKNKIPETGERFYIQCLEDGLFEGRKKSYILLALF